MKNLLFSSILIFICFSACSKKDEAKPDELDYYPTSKNSQWKYVWELTSNNEVNLENAKSQALGDTIVDGKQYAMIGDPSMLQPYFPLLVRKENGKYYQRGEIYGKYGAEELFLQDNLPVGSTWIIQDTPDIKTVNTIVSKDETRMIGGQEYKHTLEVKRESFIYIPNKNEYILDYTDARIYAKGVGLVEWSTDQRRIALKEYQIQ
ncbi:hypothetical protein Q0590_22765 [Rhodocytophaga aerolata]|uniref:LPS export ABC transporter periplasmic protein LptC n=1 Tax=Rhodocytophaga aerolata TaxID=455078 RepID=A0ABT8RAI6_9BACT|nr:hypothetical protein [Rhodocytophaga aerolata]MDO1449117.1 hypothetical protein [Rhodocytophaga aerolata]